MSATVHAHNELPNGIAAQGSVVVTVNTTNQVIRDPAGNIVFQGPATIKLVDGEATFTLPASNDVTLQPSGFTFTATEQLTHVSQSNYRSVEFQTVNGQTHHLADFSSSDEIAADPTYGSSGMIPLVSASSGTAYTVTAPAHGESRVKLTLTGNATLTLAGGTTGEVCALQLHLIQDATGSRTVTWPSNLDWGVNGPPTLSTTVGKTDRVYLTTDNGGASWQGAIIGGGYSTPVAPSAPTSLAATVISGDVQLDWTQGAANGATVTGNKVYRGTSSGAETLLATIAAGTTYTDTTPLEDGTTYYYKVSAVNSVGEGALSSEVSAVPGLVVVAADNFNRTDAAGSTPSNGLIGQSTPTGSKTWLNFTGSGAWSVSSNGAVCSGTNRLAGVDAAVANCTVRARVANTGAASDAGIVFRYVDANNYCTAFMDPGGYYLQKTIGGVVTNLDHSGSVASDATADLAVVLNGSTVTLYADSVQVATATIADAAVLSATKHGLMTGGSASVKFDNFQVTTP